MRRFAYETVGRFGENNGKRTCVKKNYMIEYSRCKKNTYVVSLNGAVFNAGGVKE